MDPSWVPFHIPSLSRVSVLFLAPFLLWFSYPACTPALSLFLFIVAVVLMTVLCVPVSLRPCPSVVAAAAAWHLTHCLSAQVDWKGNDKHHPHLMGEVLLTFPAACCSSTALPRMASAAVSCPSPELAQEGSQCHTQTPMALEECRSARPVFPRVGHRHPPKPGAQCGHPSLKLALKCGSSCSNFHSLSRESTSLLSVAMQL